MAQTQGYDVFSVANTSWIESGAGSINFNNAPALAATKTGSSGTCVRGNLDDGQRTTLVNGNGTISIALTTTGSAALPMSSREGANPPQLVVDTVGEPGHGCAVGAVGCAGGCERYGQDRCQLDGIDR